MNDLLINIKLPVFFTMRAWPIFPTVVLLLTFHHVECWDTAEMEVFDVVEEIKENFYELMGLTQAASTSEIKKAYRSLSKQLHPDKNDAADAEVKFRNMVSVYEVLKDPEKRKHYDRVLVDGLPDWRSAVYYYRRARKMSMLEIGLILTVVISITQYLMAWGSYWDQYRTLEYQIGRRIGKKKKKRNDATDNIPLDDIESLISKPSMKNILPIQLCMFAYKMVRYGPSMYKEYKEDANRREEMEKEEKEREEDEERQRVQHEEQMKARKNQPKKRKKLHIPEGHQYYQAKEEDGCILHAPDDPMEAASKGLNTGLWSNEEFCELARLMNKFPGGTLDRWEVIAEHLNRSAYEVTKMAQKVRDKLAAGAWLQEQEQTVQSKIKVKTKGDATNSESSSDLHWNAVQQKALEKAIATFPKGTDQRWEKIAKQVPEKNADDCINRFKFLAEKIKKKKEEERLKKEEEEARMKLQEQENLEDKEDDELSEDEQQSESD